MADRRLPARNPSGVHFLSSNRVAAGLVASSMVGEGDLVLDVGAGKGAITAPLAATGAQVLAIERDQAFVTRLQRRFADRPQVRVIHGDLRTVPLPRRQFWLVASIPFGVSTPLLRRVLDPPRPSLAGADLLVEWGLARRLTQPRPRNLETAWWAARFQLQLKRRVGAGCFTPPPAVDAAHLVIRPHPGLTDRRAQRMAWALLHAAYTTPQQPARAVLGTLTPKRRSHRLLTTSGIDPPTPAGMVPVAHWVQLALSLSASDTAWLPPPRRRSG